MHLTLYQTAQRLYAVRQTVGREGQEEFRVLKLDRTSPTLDACEDPTPYTKPQIQRLLAAIHAGECSTGSSAGRAVELPNKPEPLPQPAWVQPWVQPFPGLWPLPRRAGNRHIGGLQLVCDASAIVGVVQLLEGPYLLLVTRRRYLGAICGAWPGGVPVCGCGDLGCVPCSVDESCSVRFPCIPSPTSLPNQAALATIATAGHKVYGIDATALLPILCPATHRAAYGTQHASTAEQRYRKLLAGVQLTKDFFFSYSWPVHQTAQRTFAQPPAEEWDEAAAAEAFEAKSVWNEFLSRPLREALGDSAARWVVPLAHGFFQQRPLALLGRTLHLTLVARRSRQVGAPVWGAGAGMAAGNGCAGPGRGWQQLAGPTLEPPSSPPLAFRSLRARGT